MNLLIDLCVLASGSALLIALSWKWTLPPGKSAILIAIGAGTAAGSIAGLQAFSVPLWLAIPATWACQLVGFLAPLAWLFYRDPERTIPPDSGQLLSPADGEVIYIRKVMPGRIPTAEKKGKLLLLDDLGQTPLGSQELWQIGISMVFTDVHVNRAPIAGSVTLLKHRPGKFLSLRDEDAVGVNERQTIVIENTLVQIGLVQIASRLVRRIVAYVSAGDIVEAGQRIGMIKFGSQVDLFIPVGQCASVEIRVSDLVVAGVTSIARIERRSQPGA
jgi:phosphatidylserine decarboxylase